MTFEYSQEVLDDYEKLLENDNGYDVIIYAGENENVKEIHAHSLILRARSQYFHAGLSKNWAEKKDGKFVFNKPNISPEFFKIILRFIYCGKIDLTNLQGSEVFKLLISVDELNIQVLISYIQEHLIKHQQEFLQQNSDILETIYQHESLFKDLYDIYFENICGEPKILFDTDKFINLNTNLLESFLKRDDLILEEIFIWDSLIKWCIAQNSNISKDVWEWNKDDVTIMKRTIHKFIPLIRFYNISSEDFISKVYPYKELLPDNLISNIFTFHEDKKPNINLQSHRRSKSTLIQAKHFSIFSSWIEKKNDSHYSTRKNPYNFNLLYRASRDGNTAEKFHEKCDNKEATIVVVKIENSEQIVGGYNPLFWDSSHPYSSNSTKDSFIFSFTNRTSLQTANVGYSNGNKCSIQCHLNYGPLFGYGELFFGGNSDNSWYRNSDHCIINSSYPKVSIPIGNFNADDYEVFQIVKK